MFRDRRRGSRPARCATWWRCRKNSPSWCRHGRRVTHQRRRSVRGARRERVRCAALPPTAGPPLRLRTAEHSRRCRGSAKATMPTRCMSTHPAFRSTPLSRVKAEALARNDINSNRHDAQLHLSPQGRGRRASSDARRVRGSRELECVERAPHPKPALRSGFDLSPAGRGR